MVVKIFITKPLFMKPPFFFSLLLSVLCAPLSFSQENEKLQNIEEKLARYSGTKSPEKTYIHTDKDIYLNGETIWYKAYLVDGIDHIISDKSRLMYIELVNAQDSTLISQKVFVENFGAAGNMELPETLEAGRYTLRGYTKYMLNENVPIIFAKKITVWDASNARIEEASYQPKASTLVDTILRKELVVDFFPEGGTLVYGIQNTIGIKITDNQGNEITTSGKIKDQNNSSIQDFETYEFGLGKFAYLPKVGHTYYASILINGEEKKFALPVPENDGYVLNLVQHKEQITIRLSTTIPDGLKGALLIGHIRGRMFLKHSHDTNKSSYSVRIPIKDVADGVAHFTLFTPSGEPVCERLVFINNNNATNALAIETPLPAYNKRQKVDAKLLLDTSTNDTILSSFSATVIYDSGIKSNSTQNIKSWLLLNSDVGGTIHNAGFFFEENSIKRRNLLDALMLTHGWRRFVWQEILDEKVSKALPFEPEKGIMIHGKTTAFNNKFKTTPSFLNLSILKPTLYQENKNTANNGNFSFGPYIFQDTVEVFIQSIPKTKSQRSSENEIAIYIDTFNPNIERSNFLPPVKNIINKLPEKYLEAAIQKKIIDFNADPRAIKLKEVTVVTKPKTPKELLDKRISQVVRYTDPSKRIFVDSITGFSPITAFDVLLTNGGAGVQVFGSLGTQTARIRTYPPLFLLDGMEVNDTLINNLPASAIEFIDVVKSPTAVYRNSGNGIIAVYTKGFIGFIPGSEKNIPNIINTNIVGFHKTREFYSPRFDVLKEEHKLKDFRTTLHWQPDIPINKNGIGTLSFFTGDVSGNYLIHVEGITADGIPISVKKTFEVEEGTN